MFKKQLNDNADVFAYVAGEGGSVNIGGCSAAW